MFTIDDIKEKLTEIQLLIAEDDIDSSVKKLLMYVRDFDETKEYIQDAIVISATYKRITKEIRRETISNEEADKKMNKLLYRMLDVINDVEESLVLSLVA
jgi:hypothetical protein